MDALRIVKCTDSCNGTRYTLYLHSSEYNCLRRLLNSVCLPSESKSVDKIRKDFLRELPPDLVRKCNSLVTPINLYF